MNPEAQRIAIAEFCGWKSIGREKNLPLYGWISPGPLEEIPDYCNDLNAMHEAEKVLTNIQREHYRTELVYQYSGGDIFATAAQRAEAFLRTIGKWKE